MVRFEVTINEEMVNLLERISFELEGQKRVIKELISENADNGRFMENQAFIAFNKRYEEKNAEYEIAKQEVQSTYVPAALLQADTKNDTEWSLDYRTQVLTITYKGNKFDGKTFEEVAAIECSCDGTCTTCGCR